MYAELMALKPLTQAVDNNDYRTKDYLAPVKVGYIRQQVDCQLLKLIC